MNCGRVFFAENEEGWGAGVNANRRRKTEENANLVCRSCIARYLEAEIRVIPIYNTVKKVTAIMILIVLSI